MRAMENDPDQNNQGANFMNEKEIYNKAKEEHRKAYESIEKVLDEDLINAMDDLVVLSVNMNLSLEDLLSGKYDPTVETTIEILFKGRGGNTCKSGLDCWNCLRQIETKYITAAYNFVLAGRNI